MHRISIDEPHFGPHRRVLRAALKPARAGAQWTGITTPCSDNTTTARFHEFLALMAAETNDDPQRITYLEFRADYHVEMRNDDGRTRRADPAAAAVKAAGRLLPDDLPHLRRLHQCAGRHRRRSQKKSAFRGSFPRFTHAAIKHHGRN